MARWLSVLLLCAGVYCTGQAGWIHAKAWLAQQLIAGAWAQSLRQPGTEHRPWAWADTFPVARLQLPGGEDLYVLNGGQGNALAFGPGLVEGSDQPGSGFSVIGGHRDTHFRALAQVAPGQRFRVQASSGHWIDYEIQQAAVVNVREQPLVKQNAQQILLITCYPFSGVTADAEQRFVVSGRKISL